MKRLKHGQAPEITREMYDKVRRYNRLKFGAFCDELYRNGYTDGLESAPPVDPDKLLDMLKDTPGIGRQTIAKVMARVKEALAEEERINEP